MCTVMLEMKGSLTIGMSSCDLGRIFPFLIVRDRG